MTEVSSKGYQIPYRGVNGSQRRLYGSFVDVRDPDFETLRKALDHIQTEIDEATDKIDKDTFAPVVRAAYDAIRQELVIRLAWSAIGKEDGHAAD